MCCGLYETVHSDLCQNAITASYWAYLLDVIMLTAWCLSQRRLHVHWPAAAEQISKSSPHLWLRLHLRCTPPGPTRHEGARPSSESRRCAPAP